MIELRFRHCSATHPGAIRQANQDALLCRPEIGLFAVADGAGGHQDGALAARSTLQRLEQMPAGCAPAAMITAVRDSAATAHRHLHATGQAREPRAVLATTLVVLLVHDNHFACLWAGDSRCYLLRDGTLHRLTNDHSLVQSLVDAGDITEAEADTHPKAHVITRAIGAGEAELSLDKVGGTLLPRDRLLLCSDGLYKCLSTDQITDMLGRPDTDAHGLVAAALAHGARDNVSVVVVDTMTGAGMPGSST